jgi:hypothetical protein
MRLDRIHLNIPDFRLVVFTVTNRPVMKPDLPNFHPIPGLLMNLVRTPAFDELDGLLKRGRSTRSEKEMKMIRHYDEFMKQEDALVTASENALN